jgi:hypothetical protein
MSYSLDELVKDSIKQLTYFIMKRQIQAGTYGS